MAQGMNGGGECPQEGGHFAELASREAKFRICTLFMESVAGADPDACVPSAVSRDSVGRLELPVASSQMHAASSYRSCESFPAKISSCIYSAEFVAALLTCYNITYTVHTCHICVPGMWNNPLRGRGGQTRAYQIYVVNEGCALGTKLEAS